MLYGQNESWLSNFRLNCLDNQTFENVNLLHRACATIMHYYSNSLKLGRKSNNIELNLLRFAINFNTRNVEERVKN